VENLRKYIDVDLVGEDLLLAAHALGVVIGRGFVGDGRRLVRRGERRCGFRGGRLRLRRRLGVQQGQRRHADRRCGAAAHEPAQRRLQRFGQMAHQRRQALIQPVQ